MHNSPIPSELPAEVEPLFIPGPRAVGREGIAHEITSAVSLLQHTVLRHGSVQRSAGMGEAEDIKNLQKLADSREGSDRKSTEH